MPSLSCFKVVLDVFSSSFSVQLRANWVMAQSGDLIR